MLNSKNSTSQDFNTLSLAQTRLFLNQRLDWVLLTFGIFLILGLTYFALVEIKNSDFTHSLLVSQAIIEHQTVRLDAYKDTIDLAHHFDYNYRIEKINGHYYYFFPIAPSVFAVPVVWVANLLGKDMAVHEQEYELLKFMAVISCALIFTIIYQICRCYLRPFSSFVIAVVFMLGSAFVSTMGTALWNMNVTVILISASLLLVVLYDVGRLRAINPFLLGFLLFCAFWSRPTVAPFILVVFTYIFFKQRVIFFRLIVTSATFLLLFIGWSWLTYGQALPNYYLPSRLTATPNFWEAFYGNAFSPARGLFIFSPFLILIVVGVFWFWRDVKKYNLFWLCLIWFILYYIAISRKNEDWWGGHQFGPRLLIDGLPALLLITVFLWREISEHAPTITKSFAVGSFMILGGLGIFINSYQGLYNPSTYQWNKSPNIDRYPEYLFDWKYPQFLASEESLRRRNLEHQQKQLNNYAIGNEIAFNSKDAVFWNWQEPETGWRWTQSASSGLVFKLGSNALEPDKQYVLEILGASQKAQQIGVFINDIELGNLKLVAFNGAMPDSHTFIFNPALLKENDLNKIDFQIPTADLLKTEDARTSGMAFVWLRLYPYLQDSKGIHYFDSQRLKTGFSNIEQGWRWTDGRRATILYPLETIESDKDYILEITSGALGTQTVEIALNGTHLGTFTFEGFEAQTQSLTFSGGLLAKPDNEVELLIPNATVPPGDSRQLGLAFVSLNMYVNR